jgi:hypothetical protein
MNIILRQRVEHVVMPLVRLLYRCDLSWADREEISSAIACSFRHWSDMEAEREMLNQKACAKQCSAEPKDLKLRQAEWDAMYGGDGGMGEMSISGFQIPQRPTE